MPLTKCCKQKWDTPAGCPVSLNAETGEIKCINCNRVYDPPSMELIEARAEIALHKRRAEEWEKAYTDLNL